MKRMTLSVAALSLMVATSGAAFAADATKMPESAKGKSAVHATVTKDGSQKKDQAETK